MDKSTETTINWPVIFDNLLDVESYDQVSDRYQELSNLDGNAYLRLDLEESVSFKWSGKLGHPITHSDAERWAKKVAEHDLWRFVMGFPEAVPKQTVQALSEFQPPLTLYRYDLGERTLVIPTGDFRKMGLYEFAGENTRALLNDFLVMYSVARRLSGRHFSESFRLCGHTNCPRFEDNLCNTWPFIPQRYQDCSFGDRLTYVLETYLKTNSSAAGRGAR